MSRVRKKKDEEPKQWEYVARPTRSGRGQPARTDEEVTQPATPDVPLTNKRKRKAHPRATNNPQPSDDEQDVLRKVPRRSRTAAQSAPGKLTQPPDGSDFEDTVGLDDSGHEDETFTPIAEPTKKRTRAKKMAAPQTAKGMLPLTNELEEFRIPISERWANSTKFVKFCSDGTIKPDPKAPHEYKPNKGQASYIWDLPDQHYGFYLVEEDVALYEWKRADGSTDKGWKLVVRNSKDKKFGAVQLFTWSGSKKTDVHRNAITQNVCPNRSEAIRLGRITADIMNRMPEKLDSSTFTKAPSGMTIGYARKFIDIAALIHWKPNLNFRDLHADFIDHPTVGAPPGKSRGLYGPAMVVQTAKYACQTASLAPYFRLGFKSRDTAIGISMSTESVDVSKTGSEIDVPDGYSFRNIYLDPNGPAEVGSRDTSDVKVRAALRVLQHVHYRMAGMVGNQTQLVAEVDRLLEERKGSLTQAVPRSRRRRVGGSYNGGYLFTKPVLTPDDTIIGMPVGVFNCLGIEYSNGHAFRLRIRSSNRIAHAYPMNQAYIALRSGKSLLHALQAAFHAADEVNLGVITIKQIKETYCLCRVADRDNTEHPCMHCGKANTCSMMVCDSEDRILCGKCGTDRVTEDDRASIDRDVRKCVYAARKNDKKKGQNDPNWTSDFLATQLIKTHKIDEEHFRDGYDAIVSTDRGRYDEVCESGQTGSSLTALRPFRLSLEKPYPCWLDKDDGKLYLHHPENATMTLLCTNFCLGKHSGAMVPWDKIALELTEQTKDMKPTPEHDPSTQAQWEACERATDNIYAIRSQVPHTNRLRTDVRNAYANRKGFKELIQQLKSGIWHGQSAVAEFKSSADSHLYHHRLKSPSTFTPWTGTQIDLLIKHLKFLESSERFNPHGLTFVRNPDGSPWFWRRGHRPTNADWAMLNREFQARFWTMDEDCDWGSLTSESPCTLFLLYAIQWLRNGGKCHIFGYTMTWVVGHPCIFSIGRAVSVNSDDGMHIRDVQPGETMLTGFVSSFPTDIDAEYDFTRCTIIIESWRANSLRSNFLGGRDLIDRLKQSVRDRALETKWYGAPQPKDAYRQLPKIGTYIPGVRKVNPRLKHPLKRVSYVESDDEEVYDEDIEEDEEVDSELTEDEVDDDSFDILNSDGDEEYEDSDKENDSKKGKKKVAVQKASSQSGDGGEDNNGEDDEDAFMGEQSAGVLQSAQQSHGQQHQNRQVYLNAATQAKIISRHGDLTRLKNSVDEDHLMADFLVSVGKAPRDIPTYPTKDNTFCTYNGVEPMATFDDTGNVYDLEGNFLGNPISDED